MPGETIKASFGLDISPLRAAANQARGLIGGMASSLSRGFAGPAARASALLGGVVSIGTFSRGVQGAVNLGSELHNLSKSTGIAVGQLYQLQGVFAESEMGAEDVATSVGKMQKSIEKGGTAFKLIGLSVQDLKGLQPAEQFKAIGAAILDLKTPSERTAAAMAIFGKSGARLMPVFEDIQKVDLSKLSQAAALMQKNAAAFDELGDAGTRAKRAFQGMFVGIAAGIAGGALEGANAIEKIDWAGKGVLIGNELSKGMKAAAGFAQLLKTPTAKGENVDAAKDMGAQFADNFKDSLKSDLYSGGKFLSKILPPSVFSALSNIGSKAMGAVGLGGGFSPGVMKAMGLVDKPPDSAKTAADPMSTTSTATTGWGKLESFKTFADPYGNGRSTSMGDSGSAARDMKRVTDFNSFFHPNNEEGGRLKPVGSYGALGHGFVGLGKAYGNSQVGPSHPDAYKTHPDAYAQTPGAGEDEGKDESQKTLEDILQEIRGLKEGE